MGSEGGKLQLEEIHFSLMHLIFYRGKVDWTGGGGVGPSRAREGKRNQVGVREGRDRDPPFLFPRRHNSFSFRLALGTMGREGSRAFQLHVKRIVTERM